MDMAAHKPGLRNHWPGIQPSWSAMQRCRHWAVQAGLTALVAMAHSRNHLLLSTKLQFTLYGYYLAAAWLLRSISPPLAQFAAAEAGLNGSYRTAQARLVASAEEVAFNDPPAGMPQAQGGQGMGTAQQSVRGCWRPLLSAGNTVAAWQAVCSKPSHSALRPTCRRPQ